MFCRKLGSLQDMQWFSPKVKICGSIIAAITPAVQRFGQSLLLFMIYNELPRLELAKNAVSKTEEIENYRFSKSCTATADNLIIIHVDGTCCHRTTRAVTSATAAIYLLFNRRDRVTAVRWEHRLLDIEDYQFHYTEPSFVEGCEGMMRSEMQPIHEEILNTAELGLYLSARSGSKSDVGQTCDDSKIKTFIFLVFVRDQTRTVVGAMCIQLKGLLRTEQRGRKQK
ncbi:hypothetical protein F2P81_017346 [Scophthalmus maximus]|uniref:Uncharacterized protein n=1 Tax=Scophthalmus maximus TaxID=52904 RepID=A0A6A4SDQ2_SCOMX|nr:hypothetical protein F2P81_017346 [Scophthalmus maximus]